MNTRSLISTLLILAVARAHAATPALADSESAHEPIIYTGTIQTDKNFTDGRLPHAVGVQHYQVFRANRSHPPEGGVTGWTYNHQPYLAYWNGRFYLQYLSALFQEHTPPTHTSIMSSLDGRTWSAPLVVFPEYQLPAIEQEGGISIKAGTLAVVHQRMGWYVAPNGKLLTLGFYGFAMTPRQSPNAGNGLGRVVREVKADGSLGPIYFIRYNRHAGFNEKNTSYPFYRESKDAEFLAACEALLQDKLVTLQWWEEDRGKDGFYTVNPEEVAGAASFTAKTVTSAGAGKAFTWYTRPDGVVVGMWKNQYSSLSPDRGKSWTPIVTNKTLWDAGSKTWGQRTTDGRYVIVQDQSASRSNRFPMVAMVGSDGHLFDSMYCLQAEIPPRRYEGQFKSPGTAYFRGISEGDGTPPGSYLWITYSMNKEDIWVSRTTVPILGSETEPLKEDFEHLNTVGDLQRWNLYIPQWAQIQPVLETGTSNHVLELRDEEPYDYAKAERVFPVSQKVTVKFRVQARTIAHGSALYIEVQSQHGDRPMSLRLDDAWLGFDRAAFTNDPMAIDLRRWYAVELELDCARQSYTARIDGKEIYKGMPFAEKAASLERIVFRTGPFRGWVSPAVVDKGSDKPSGLDTEDLPGADERTTPSVYWIDDVETH